MYLSNLRGKVFFLNQSIRKTEFYSGYNYLSTSSMSELSQKIFDIVFKDLDYSLRELGAGDVSVANNMKKLISSYMGRQKIYVKAFKSEDEKLLALAFKNNIFRNKDQKKNLILLLSKNIFRINKKLDLIDDKKILNGDFDFSINLL